MVEPDLSFPSPSVIIEPESYAKTFTELDDCLSEVITGIIPLNPVVLLSYFEATIPYLPAIIKTLVPSPKAIPGTEKLLTTFSLSVWLTVCLVLPLTTAVLWCASNGPYRSVCNETYTYQSLSSCFHNAWSILVAFLFLISPQILA